MSRILTPSGPLTNRGHDCAPQESNFTSNPRSWAGNGGRFSVGLDKLDVSWVVPPRSECDDCGVFGAPWQPPKQGRRLGAYTCTTRAAYVPGEADASGIRYELREYEGLHSRRLYAFLNPAKLTDTSWSGLRRTLAMYGADGRDPVLERVDVCFDRQSDPYAIKIDAGRHKPDYHGVTRRGPETETIGRRKGANHHQVRRYDKRAERIANAKQDPGHDWVRVEVQLRRKALASCIGVEDPKLSMLTDLANPFPEYVRIVELVRDPKAYSELLYSLIGCSAIVYGPKFARQAAREILGIRSAESLTYSMWADQTDALVGAWSECSSSLVDEALDVLQVQAA